MYTIRNEFNKRNIKMRQEKHQGHGRRHGHEHKRRGAQTFRRGRALDFLGRLDVKRETLLRQLGQAELQSIHPMISGELKAVEMIRDEFMELFDLDELEDEAIDDGLEAVGLEEKEDLA